MYTVALRVTQHLTAQTLCHTLSENMDTIRDASLIQQVGIVNKYVSSKKKYQVPLSNVGVLASVRMFQASLNLRLSFESHRTKLPQNHSSSFDFYRNPCYSINIIIHSGNPQTRISLMNHQSPKQRTCLTWKTAVGMTADWPLRLGRSMKRPRPLTRRLGGLLSPIPW